MATFIGGWLEDLRIAAAFLTRIPVPHPDGPASASFSRAHRAFPIIAALIGAAVGLIYLGLLHLHIPVLAAAALAVGAGAWLTGGLHEDGLADVADGFGGGRDKAAKLEIMRDSRLGTYGALALLVVLTVRVAAIAALPAASVLASLVAVHALARPPVTVIAALLPPARAEGLSASAGRPDAATTLTAIALGIAIACLVLPTWLAFAAAAAAAAGALLIAWLGVRQIGGQTGDVLGAAEQTAETAVLLLLSAQAAGTV